MTDNILLGGIFLLEFILFYFLPVFNGKDTLFGFVISQEDDKGGVSKVLGNYRIGLIIIAVIFLTLTFLLNLYYPKSLAIAYIFFALTMSFWLYTHLLKSWRLRKIEVFSKFVAQLKPRQLKDFTKVWLEVAIILLTVIPIVVLAYYYPQLPEKVPVHWNAGGEADRWAAKSVLSVFFISFLSIYLQIFLLITKSDLVKARFRIPAENAEKIFPLKEITHLANINLMDWSRLMISVLFASISLLILSTLVSEVWAKVINLGNLLGIVLLVTGIGYYWYQITLANRQIKEISGQIVFQTMDEEQSWSDGVFYNNDDDAAFFIEKPSGGGYTVNMANKRSYLYFAMIGGLVLISISAVAFI